MQRLCRIIILGIRILHMIKLTILRHGHWLVADQILVAFSHVTRPKPESSDEAFFYEEITHYFRYGFMFRSLG